MLSFSQLNLHKASQATVLLGRGMEGCRQTIALITEPYTYESKITGLPRGTKVIYDRTCPKNAAPRAGIVCSQDVNLTAMESWCTRDCAVALSRANGKHTVLVSLYMDINLEVQPEWLGKLMQMLEGKGYPVIMGIDTNAHSVMYGIGQNTRGNAVEDFILQYGLNIENVGTTPTFEIRRGNKLVQTHIDVTLSRGLLNGVKNWRVSRDYNASDHNTILFEIDCQKPEPELIRPWSKADWVTFAKELKLADYRIPKDISMKKLDKLVTRTYAVLEAALDKACPKQKFSPTVSKSHWATEKHDTAKKKVSALYKLAKNKNDETSWEAYRNADRDFKKMCKNDKNRSWRKYKECIQSEKEMASLARDAQREERRDINVLQRQDGSSTDPGAETIDLLTETHFPAATNTKHVTYNNRRNLAVESVKDKYKDWIDCHKIRAALNGFEKKKSPGPDELKPLVFDHLPDEFLAALEIIYKSSIHLGYTPKAWKRTKVIFISKPGKESYDKPKSFRPISLSNYLLKGLELSLIHI